jgi:hypothetical protein
MHTRTVAHRALYLFLACLPLAPALQKPAAAQVRLEPTTKLTVIVKSQSGRPVDRASVVVRFVEGRSIAKLGKHVRTTFELRTNQQGEAIIPEIPRGRFRVQVIAKGYQTYGQVFEANQPEKTVDVMLNPPQQQYSAH